MEITNKYPVTIFKNEYGKYVAGISKKNSEGKYENAYFQVVFNKDVHLENKTKIYIKNAWLDFYNYTYEGKKGTKWYIRISQFDTVAEEILKSKQENDIINKQEDKDPWEDFGEDFGDNSSLDLPF